jgi:hypothetical protein
VQDIDAALDIENFTPSQLGFTSSLFIVRGLQNMASIMTTAGTF